MNESGGLQGLARPFPGHLLRRQLAQFVINQRQELLGGVRVALLDGGKDASNVGHRHQAPEGFTSRPEYTSRVGASPGYAEGRAKPTAPEAGMIG